MSCTSRRRRQAISTSPGSCLERGVHVYVEKPFTLDAEEAEELVALATRRTSKITAGHDDQFSHVARRMRALVESGYLGGAPVHMESTYCYDLSEPGYATALLGDKRHWVRGLPGGLLQNIISHGIARIAEFLSTESPHVIAHGFVSPLLRSIGENDIVDELRVIIADDERTTAYFTFSSQMRPSIHEFRIYGPKNGLVLDQDHETLITLRGSAVQELRGEVRSAADCRAAAHRQRHHEREDVPGARLSDEVRHEVPHRVVLPIDRRATLRCRSRTGRFS